MENSYFYQNFINTQHRFLFTTLILFWILYFNNCGSQVSRYRQRAGTRKQRGIQVVTGHRPSPHPRPYRPPSVLSNIVTSEHSSTSRDFNYPDHNVSPSQSSNVSSFNVHYFNARSCRNKTEDIYGFLEDNDVDVLFITETWLECVGDEPTITAMTPPSYKCHSFPRQGRRGGGIAVMYRTNLDPYMSILSPISSYVTFEFLHLQLRFNRQIFNFTCIYRPPSTSTHYFRMPDIRNEFNDLFTDLSNKPGELVVVGDFNFKHHCDGRPSELCDILTHNDLQQIVSEPTHQSGSIIDWVVVRNSSPSIIDAVVSDAPFSDHHSINIKMQIERPSHQRVSITSRDIRSIDGDQFRAQLTEALSELDQTPATAEEWNSRVSTVVDAHAPMKSRCVPKRRFSPWYCEEVKAAKTQRRAAERKWKKSGLNADREDYCIKRKQLRTIIRNCKKSYYQSKFIQSKSCKQLFDSCNELLGKSKSSPLPNSIPDLPNAFANFFEEKVNKIRSNLDSFNSQTQDKTFNGTPLDSFIPVTEDYINNLITKAPTKSCELDPIPSSILPLCTEVITPTITSMINNSLATGIVPECFKEALVRPLLKKSNLDRNDLKNYRPVSNLSFISKILEKVVLNQILKHMHDNDLLHRFQSAYRAHHSTETALLKVINDLIVEADSNRCSILCLLDLSAAFDTIDHDILMARLENTFGINGTVLQWFESYIRGRHQCVMIDGVRSEEKVLHFGVPQGSVLGPVLFTMYMLPLADVISRHGIKHHLYADDTQLYSSSSINDVDSLCNTFESCLIDVKSWTNNNKLMLNDDKTEALLAGRPNVLRNTDISGIKVGDSHVGFSSHVKSLGVLIDCNFTFSNQVNSIIQKLNIDLRRIRQIRYLLSNETASTLISSLVLSKLDYCNSLLSNVTKDKIKSLQIVQNNAARLALQKPRLYPATPLLTQLHWLPVEKRIIYKVCSVVYKSLNTCEPAYIRDMLHIYTPTRNLRSKNDKSLLVKPHTFRKIGEQSFIFSAPNFWNSLPEFVRSSDSLTTFKKRLKTYLFTI